MLIPDSNGQPQHGHHGNRWIRLDELAAFCQRPGAEDTKKEVKLAKGISNDKKKSPETYSSTNKDDSITIQHVKKQIAALQIGDYEAAFNLNSPANKKDWYRFTPEFMDGIY